MAGNPYYIPRKKSPILDYARLGLGAYGLYQQGQRQDIEKPLIEARTEHLGEETEKLRAARKWRESLTGAEEVPGMTGKTPGQVLGGGLTERQKAVGASLGFKMPEEEEVNQYKESWNEWMGEPFDAGNLMRSKAENPYMADAFDYIMEKNYKSRIEAMPELIAMESSFLAGARIKGQKDLDKAVKDKNLAEIERITKAMNQLKPGIIAERFGITPQTAPILLGEEYKEAGGTVLKPEETLVGPRGKEIARGLPAREKPPTDITTWQTPQGDIVNLPKGELPPTGSVPYTKPESMSEEDKNKTKRVLLKRGSDIAKARAVLDKGGVVDQLTALLAQKYGQSLEIGKPVPEDAKKALEAQWAIEIEEINRQLEGLGYKVPKEATIPTKPPGQGWGEELLGTKKNK